MSKKRFERIGLDREQVREVIDFLKERDVAYASDNSMDSHLDYMCESLQMAADKYNLTHHQVAMLAYDMGEFNTVLAIMMEQTDTLDQKSLRFIQDFVSLKS